MKVYSKEKVYFEKKINDEVLLYFPHALARCLTQFSRRSRRCPIDISLDIDNSLYSDLKPRILKNTTGFCWGGGVEMK